jgi:hypothetical protein
MKDKKDHGKHQANIDAVLKAMDQAGTDPRARITAGLGQMFENSKKTKEHDLREAVDHAGANYKDIVAYAYNDPAPK